MKLGILADIHEHVEELHDCINALRSLGVNQFIVLGDVCETGARMQETVELLQSAHAIGVWGNHDCAFCIDPSPELYDRYSRTVIDYMQTFKPRLEVDGCLFTHVEPWLDANKVEDLWYFDGPPDSAEKLARTFDAVPNSVCFMGHMHRWLHGNRQGVSNWRGETPIMLDDSSPHLVVVHAVWHRSCALFDTESRLLMPINLAVQ